MGKLWVEVCLISARGLRRTSSLWKLQWFAVGWIDPSNKYCTKIDASGNANPVWKTKFSALLDTCEHSFQDLALHLEVYSREPIFLRTKLLGTASVLLKEFVDKYMEGSKFLKPIEEVGSFQLRTKNSNKPQGFVDISIRISAEREEPTSYPGDHEGYKLDSSYGISLPNQSGTLQSDPPQPPIILQQRPENHLQTGSQPPIILQHRPENQSQRSSQPPITVRQRPEIHPQRSSQHAHTTPRTPSCSNPSVAGQSYGPVSGPNYQPPPMPPPPPANVGYIPKFLPRAEHIPPSYTTMPSSGAAPGHPTGPGFGMGLGAGALAAGAVIFGDDFLSGFEYPSGLQDGSIDISIEPPF